MFSRFTGRPGCVPRQHHTHDNHVSNEHGRCGADVNVNIDLSGDVFLNRATGQVTMSVGKYQSMVNKLSSLSYATSSPPAVPTSGTTQQVLKQVYDGALMDDNTTPVLVVMSQMQHTAFQGLQMLQPVAPLGDGRDAHMQVLWPALYQLRKLSQATWAMELRLGLDAEHLAVGLRQRHALERIAVDLLFEDGSDGSLARSRPSPAEQITVLSAEIALLTQRGNVIAEAIAAGRRQLCRHALDLSHVHDVPDYNCTSPTRQPLTMRLVAAGASVLDRACGFLDHKAQKCVQDGRLKRDEALPYVDACGSAQSVWLSCELEVRKYLGPFPKDAIASQSDGVSSSRGTYRPSAEMLCRWVHMFGTRRWQEKLTAEATQLIADARAAYEAGTVACNCNGSPVSVRGHVQNRKATPTAPAPAFPLPQTPTSDSSVPVLTDSSLSASPEPLSPPHLVAHSLPQFSTPPRMVPQVQPPSQRPLVGPLAQPLPMSSSSQPTLSSPSPQAATSQLSLATWISNTLSTSSPPTAKLGQIPHQSDNLSHDIDDNTSLSSVMSNSIATALTMSRVACPPWFTPHPPSRPLSQLSTRRKGPKESCGPRTAVMTSNRAPPPSPTSQAVRSTTSSSTLASQRHTPSAIRTPAHPPNTQRQAVATPSAPPAPSVPSTPLHSSARPHPQLPVRPVSPLTAADRSAPRRPISPLLEDQPGSGGTPTTTSALNQHGAIRGRPPKREEALRRPQWR